MKARILFLGTGGDAFVIGKQYRASAGIILNIDDNRFYINPGPGSLVIAKMMGINLREITAIFVTNNNLFSANDLNAVISAMTHNGLDKRGVLVCPSSVISNGDSDPFLNKYYRKCLEKCIQVDNTRKLAINNVDIEIIPMKEHISQACGFKFINPRFILSYVADTSFTSELGEDLQGTDILILSVPDPHGVERKGHLNSKSAERLIKTVQPQLAIITGFGIKMLQAEPLYEARQIQKESGIQVIAAKDGMTINPISFSATVRQKSLKKY